MPGHWRSAPAFSDNDGPLLYRTRFELDAGPAGRPPLGGARRRLLPGRRLPRRRLPRGPGGLLLPPLLRDHRPGPPRHRARARRRGGLQPAGDRRAKRNLTGIFQHWDCMDPTWNPGGLWRGGADRAHRAGAHQPPARPVPRRRSGPRQRHGPGRARQRRRPHGAGPHDAWTATSSGSWSTRWPRAPTRSSGPSAWTTRSCGGPARSATSRWSARGDGVRRPRAQPRPSASAPDCGRWRCTDWTLSVNGERLFLKGANAGPDPHGAGRGDAGRAPPRRRAGRGRRSRPAAHPRSHHAPRAVRGRRRARHAASGRTSRCSGGTPARSASRPPARPRRRSTCSATTRRSPCGAVTTSRWPSTCRPASRSPTPRRHGRRRRPGAAELEPLDPRRAASSGRSSGPTAPARSSPTPGVAPHLPQLDGTDSHLYFGWYHGQERELPGFAAAWPRMVRFVSEFGAQAVPTDAAFMEPERWPDLDWDHLQRRHSLQKWVFDERVPPGRYETFAAWQDATQRYQARLLRHHIETLRRLKYRPTGGFCLFSLADAAPAVTWSRPRPRPDGQARLPRRRRTPAGRSSSWPTGCLPAWCPARRWPSTSTSSATAGRPSRTRPSRPSCPGRAATRAGAGWATSRPTPACASGPCRSVVPDSPGSARPRPGPGGGRRRGDQPLRDQDHETLTTPPRVGDQPAMTAMCDALSG